MGVAGEADNAAVITRNRFQFAKIGDESSSCDSYIDKGWALCYGKLFGLNLLTRCTENEGIFLPKPRKWLDRQKYKNTAKADNNDN